MFGTQLENGGQTRQGPFASTLNFQVGNIKNDRERLNINSIDGEDHQDQLDKYFSAEADLIDASNNELDFSERSLPNYMRNTKSREMAINESKKVNKYKLFSPQGMADMKKPSGTTLMSSASALSLNRQLMG